MTKTQTRREEKKGIEVRASEGEKETRSTREEMRGLTYRC